MWSYKITLDESVMLIIMSEGHYCPVNLNLYIKLCTGLSVK